MYLKVKDLSEDERPYEKFIKYGVESLSDIELIAVILRSGTSKKSVIDLSREVLLTHDKKISLLSLYKKSFFELKSIKGIGFVKAISLKCIAEISKRISNSSYTEKMQFKTPEQISSYYMETFRHLSQEEFCVVYLNASNYLISDVILTKGTINKSLVSSREVFQKALEMDAVNIILMHNHPSGDPTPSNDDIEVTKILSKAGDLLNIKVLDHIIIGDRNYISFRECGLFN